MSFFKLDNYSCLKHSASYLVGINHLEFIEEGTCDRLASNQEHMCGKCRLYRSRSVTRASSYVATEKRFLRWPRIETFRRAGGKEFWQRLSVHGLSLKRGWKLAHGLYSNDAKLILIHLIFAEEGVCETQETYLSNEILPTRNLPHGPGFFTDSLH